MTLDELRDEFDWMFEFQSRMAERIRDDEDVHNLVDYVTKLEAENAKLRELVRDVYALHWSGLDCTECPWIGECDTDGGCPWLGIMHDRMRELGLVDE